MRAYLAQAAQRAEPVFLLGGTAETLAALKQNLMAEFPSLIIAGAISPPFRAITPEEGAAIVAQINAFGARTVWVGLKLPQALRKMDAGAPRPGAGGHARGGGGVRRNSGAKPRAPAWLQKLGLEWLHRLASEPGRSWKRYSRH